MTGKTLKECILHGDGILDGIFVDLARDSTYCNKGKLIRGVKSPAYDCPYIIKEISDFASFDPNNNRTTLRVAFLANPNETVELYLDEQLNDREATAAEARRAGETASCRKDGESIGRMIRDKE